MLEPRRLLTFREVARQGSFSRAAEALSLSQPAVSQQVAALERELATTLLTRGPGGAVPTPTGSLLLEHADALAARLALADAQLAEAAAEDERRLRIGAFPSAVAGIVPTVLQRLTGAHPDVDVEVVEAGSHELADAVAAGGLHVALVLEEADQPTRPPVLRVELGDDPLMAAVGPRHPLAARSRIRLAELAGDVWAAPSHDHLIGRACRDAGFDPRIAFVLRDPMATAAVVAAGMAVTLVPRLLAPRLHGVRLLAVRDPPTRTLAAVLPPTGERRVARAFVREARVAYRRSRTALRPAGRSR
ncbi:MAG: hypothetical protein QOG35_1304 [Solirubrobacteraceae bacterium]|nr:hypothetical protein [Solirubrobacteraceae bacterium]